MIGLTGRWNFVIRAKASDAVVAAAGNAANAFNRRQFRILRRKHVLGNRKLAFVWRKSIRDVPIATKWQFAERSSRHIGYFAISISPRERGLKKGHNSGENLWESTRLLITVRLVACINYLELWIINYYMNAKLMRGLN